MKGISDTFIHNVFSEITALLEGWPLVKVATYIWNFPFFPLGVSFNRLDPMNLTTNMWYFPKISQNSLKISQNSLKIPQNLEQISKVLPTHTYL